MNTENVPFTRNHYHGTGFCKARAHPVTDECPKGTSHVTVWRVLCRTSSVIMISCKRHSQSHSVKNLQQQKNLWKSIKYKNTPPGCKKPFTSWWHEDVNGFLCPSGVFTEISSNSCQITDFLTPGSLILWKLRMNISRFKL